ncbi:MAG TPA: HD domain-containing phosphohydrolase [Gemmatimonadaceae bacterium]|nr:HD domain-containing phosphohydrolase [Gemmatimonadaceae bacterium]
MIDFASRELGVAQGATPPMPPVRQDRRSLGARSESERGAAVIDALVDEAMRADRAGQRELARRRYESALYLLQSRAQGAEASMILRRVGRLYLDDGDVTAGIDCAAAALAVGEALDDPAAIANATNVMAIAYWQRGLLDDAERLYREAERLAEVAGDARLVAIVEQNLGVIANMRSDVPRALRHYRASLSGYRELGLDQYVGNLLNDIGLAYAALGRWEDAERTYQEAGALSRACGDVSTALMIDVNRAEMRIARGDYAQAQLVCEEVLQQARPLNDTRVLAEAYKHHGVIARELGRPDEADEFLRISFEGAMAREDLLLAAETAREQAELYSMLRRNRETLQALNTSHRLFGRARADRDLADVRRRIHRLERRFLDIVRQWAQSIESKDRYTLGHCERVADYACALARDAGFDEQSLFWLRIGALLHDVGKIVVPSDILNKTAALTPAERAIMERHAVAGADMLQDIDFPWDVLPMIRHHHERWDGAGYPDGLRGEAIPLSARILCVADVYDALTTTRPYRPAFSRDDALRVMREDAGRVFDPTVLARLDQVALRCLMPAPLSPPFSDLPLPEGTWR